MLVGMVAVAVLLGVGFSHSATLSNGTAIGMIVCLAIFVAGFSWSW